VRATDGRCRSLRSRQITIAALRSYARAQYLLQRNRPSPCMRPNSPGPGHRERRDGVRNPSCAGTFSAQQPTRLVAGEEYRDEDRDYSCSSAAQLPWASG